MPSIASAINPLSEYIALKAKRAEECGAVGIDQKYKNVLPAALELSNPFLVTGCLLKSYWWGTSPFDRREFVKRKKAGTLYEYKPATLTCVRTEYSRKRRTMRTIFTLSHAKPQNLLQRAMWLAAAVVYVFPDDEYKRKRREIDHILLTEQIKCLERLKMMGEVLPDGIIRQNKARLARR
jgi:hypothetical protein